MLRLGTGADNGLPPPLAHSVPSAGTPVTIGVRLGGSRFALPSVWDIVTGLQRVGACFRVTISPFPQPTGRLAPCPAFPMAKAGSFDPEKLNVASTSRTTV